MPEPVVYPVPWLEGTFTSRDRTEALLKPELENGTITYHDYESATNFYPGMHKYYPMAGMTLGWAAGAAFNNYVRRPIPGAKKWWGGAFSIVSSLAGMVYGQIKRAEAHRDFVASLENRPGFFQALENVHMRTGGQRPLGLPTGRQDQQGARSALPESASQTQESYETWSEDGLSSQPTPPASTPMPTRTTQQSTTKWDDIRAAHSRNAPRSTWEEIRQRQGRSKLAKPDSTDSAEQPSSNYDGDVERAQEQAKFDAMLEAERRKAESPSEGARSWR